MTAPVTEAAAEVVTETIQKAAAPVAFLAIVIGGCLAVAVLVKRLGQSLPLPAYLADLVGDDQGVTDDPEAWLDQEEGPTREQWG